MVFLWFPRAQGSHALRRAAPQSSRRCGDRVVVPRQGPGRERPRKGWFCHMMGMMVLYVSTTWVNHRKMVV